jgi:hypothetical protein
MSKGRMEAFSDGVLAILITIMVLELAAPHAATPAALLPLIPTFLSYALSFIFIGIYWNNHHHLLQAARRVDGRVLWANLHLLFWLSLVPFVTAWMGGNRQIPSWLRPWAGISRVRFHWCPTRWPSRFPSRTPGWPGSYTSWWPFCGSSPTGASRKHWFNEQPYSARIR